VEKDKKAYPQRSQRFAEFKKWCDRLGWGTRPLHPELFGKSSIFWN